VRQTHLLPKSSRLRNMCLPSRRCGFPCLVQWQKRFAQGFCHARDLILPPPDTSTTARRPWSGLTALDCDRCPKKSSRHHHRHRLRHSRTSAIFPPRHLDVPVTTLHQEHAPAPPASTWPSWSSPATTPLCRNARAPGNPSLLGLKHGLIALTKVTSDDEHSRGGRGGSAELVQGPFWSRRRWCGPRPTGEGIPELKRPSPRLPPVEERTGRQWSAWPSTSFIVQGTVPS